MKKTCLAVLCSLLAAACLTPLPEITTLPDIQLPVVSDKQEVWTSADYVKKPILMVFMGSWCPWCKRTMPAVMEAAATYGDKVEIVAVFMDNDAESVQAAIKEHGFTVKSVYAGQELAQVLEVNGLPHSILFDKKHRAINHWEGFDPNRAEHFRNALEKVTK